MATICLSVGITREMTISLSKMGGKDFAKFRCYIVQEISTPKKWKFSIAKFTSLAALNCKMKMIREKNFGHELAK